MLPMFVALFHLDMSDGTFVAITIGFSATILLLWGTPIKRTEIFGHAFLFAALAYYLSAVAMSIVLSIWKYKIDRSGIALLISGVGGWLVGPWLKDAAPKFLNKKAGLDD